MRYYIIFEKQGKMVMYQQAFSSVQEAQSFANTNLRGIRFRVIDENILRQLQQQGQQQTQQRAMQQTRTGRPMFFDLSRRRF